MHDNIILKTTNKTVTAVKPREPGKNPLFQVVSSLTLRNVGYGVKDVPVNIWCLKKHKLLSARTYKEDEQQSIYNMTGRNIWRYLNTYRTNAQTKCVKFKMQVFTMGFKFWLRKSPGYSIWYGKFSKYSKQKEINSAWFQKRPSPEAQVRLEKLLQSNFCLRITWCQELLAKKQRWKDNRR